MNNAKLFKKVFGIYAEEFWAYPEEKMLDWLTSDATDIKVWKWINTGSGEECSKCHEIQYGYDSFRHYCPNCGAKMDGGMAEYGDGTIHCGDDDE